MKKVCTARQRYLQERTALYGVLQQIAERIEAFDAWATRHPSDWGFLGSVRHFRASLEEVRDSIGAIPEEGGGE